MAPWVRVEYGGIKTLLSLSHCYLFTIVKKWTFELDGTGI